MKYLHIYTFFLVSVFCACRQNKAEEDKTVINVKTEDEITVQGPEKITRNIIQDRKGDIWMAAFDGIFRYNGKAFTNMTTGVSSARFFSILEDRKGNYWFGSIGSGVYYYDGKSFRNFTTKDGLLNNEVGSMYEDQKGNIWFGVSGGTSCYDGKSFRNYIVEGNSMNEDRTGKTFPNRRPEEVTSIIEDKAGRFWFATRGRTFVYDGKTFTTFIHNDIPFKNVRSIIEDKKGNVWLGGSDGLWRYDGSTLTNFTQKFVGYIIEDKKGNIWTSAERDDSRAMGIPRYDGKFLPGRAWALSRYDEKSLADKQPSVTEVTVEPMIFGTLEDDKGNIWFGTFNGVFRYDGNTITGFNDKAGRHT